MDLNFSLNGSIDPVATYAALLSTAIAIWEFVKWRQRHAVELTCSPNMKFMPSSDDSTWIVAKVINKGQVQTTITHFLGYSWKNDFDRLLNRNKKAFIVGANNVPHVVQPGEQWMGQLLQDEEMVRRAREEVLYIGIIHTMGKKEVLKRVRI